MKHDADQIAKMEAVLGDPIGCEFSDDDLKIRRNLLVISSVIIVIALADIKISPSSTIMGLQFEGLTDDLIKSGLIAFLIYFVTHFLWVVCEAFSGWRVRVTGTRLSLITGAKLGEEGADYPDNPMSSTLYTWWAHNVTRVGDFGSRVSEINTALDECKRNYELLKGSSGDGAGVGEVLKEIEKINTQVFKLKAAVDILSQVMQSARIPVSLQRFDTAYKLLLRSQNLRWLVIDVGVPIMAALYAGALLLHG